MTTTANPDGQVWLAKEATPLGPFVVRLGGYRNGFSALARGHWVLVMDVAGVLRCIGRIPRIRAELESTTFHFDKLRTLKTAGSLADIGLTLPTDLITRLRPEDLSAVLARDGISSTAGVPLIQDAAYVA